MQFVVLRHVCPNGAHFDLMFERGDGTLLTWRCPRKPDLGWAQAVMLKPHRNVYLQYEGPVLGRGWVRREIRGRYRELSASADTLRVALESASLVGVLELERGFAAGAVWRYRMCSMFPCGGRVFCASGKESLLEWVGRGSS